MKKLISVIVPIYNEERFLENCFCSIINQTYKNLEIILVDDGSKKIVADFCDSFEKKDNRVKVIHKSNGGLSAARITGYNASNGDWVTFVDDDDVLPLDAIERLVAGIDKDRDVEIVAGRRADLINVDEYAPINEFVTKYTSFTGREVCEKIPDDKQKSIITPLWGKIYKKAFLDKYDLCEYQELCSTIFFEDILMTPILYARALRIVLVNNIVYIHREVNTSISRSGKLSSFYYDQIESGNILLEFCKKERLEKFYSFQLSEYYKSILRIWCLIDDDKTLDNNLFLIYKQKICKYYQKYLRDYLIKSKDRIYVKFAFCCFLISKKIWKKIVKRKFIK